ncbi:Protein YeeZ [Arenibacter antarcticus]|uniref:SDR family oxidoreductase n=1 Tax=Arenibacter antarcticus TaxID=2040469 RepID=A0ABW5VAK6_9FLAO|nr:SDR family oxidoreductase [Arenibacter sp. H213]MCM4167526.1 NAD(P)-dependent oxidoreductase [Arenibacter sp. H213]
MNKTIGILGCGWLGLPLATTLVSNNYKVHGSTTTQEKIEDLINVGITPFLIQLSEIGINGDIKGFLKDLEIVLINIPPRLRSEPKENYVKKITHLHQAIKEAKIRTVVFISSTSVYGNCQGRITEDTLPQPNTESGKQLLASENIFRKDTVLNTSIIRFGGLIGPKRHPINQLSGKKDLTNGMDSINLIHLDDCIGLIRTILTENYENVLINGVYPLHPTKKEYYTSEASKKGISPPTYLPVTNKKGDKIIENTPEIVKIYHYFTSIIS